MDDRDLEARLRTHLHHRFDSAEPPRELAAIVEQLFATQPRRVGLADLRLRQRQLGWSVVAAAAILAVVAVAGSRFGGLIGPGGTGPSSSPGPSASAERTFVVLPQSGTAPSKAESGLAADVLNERIKALGFGTFTSAVGYGIEFFLPASGPADAAIRSVLEATGDVAFVPLPAADYGNGKLTAEVGKPLPKDEPTLFGWDGIASVARDDSQPNLAITVALKPAAKGAFADYTTSHVGDRFAILIDGTVAVVPTINEPIPGGEVTISGAGADGNAFAVAAAVLIGGMLPESWREAQVPVILAKDAAIAAALGERTTATVESAEVNVIRDGTGWRAVWNIVLSGDFPGGCPPPAVESSRCPSATSQFVVLDATSGALISSSSEAPGS